MISLTDLRARRVVPAWQEAVAIVQELIHTLVQTQGRDAQLPDVDHIALIANGEVVALPGSRAAGHPVTNAARLLEQLLEGAAAPPELVTLVNDNLSETPKLPTLSELTRQLAFFERPGRRSDVEQLVSRAMSADAQDRAEEELRRLKERTLAGGELDLFETEAEIAEAGARREKKEKKEKKVRRAINRQAAAVVALVLAAAVAVGGGGWWLYSRLSGTAPSEVSAGSGAAPAADAATAADAGGAGKPADSNSPSLLERAGASIRQTVESAFGSIRAADGEGDAETDTVESATNGEEETPARPRRPRVRRAPQGASAAGAGDTSAQPAAPGPPQVSTTVEKPPIEGEPMSVGSVSDARSIVYSSDDPDVRPAMLLRPLLPATPPPDVPPDQIGTLELVVDEHGDVEHVRLLSPANRFHERMLVAHAKSWKFRPAIRDGRPVKYRTVIRLTI